MKLFTNKEWDYFCSHINFGASAMDGDAIQIMNKPLDQEKPIDEKFKDE